MKIKWEFSSPNNISPNLGNNEQLHMKYRLLGFSIGNVDHANGACRGMQKWRYF